VASGSTASNAKRELEIAREQREREVEIADRRAQDEALQAHLDQMPHPTSIR
jgi:hypothetical protein